MDSLDALHNRVLDQPQSIDVDALDPAATRLLANQELLAVADARSDLLDLRWPRTDSSYARAIETRLTAYHGDPLEPIANRYYPGFQETIFGSEGLILSKRMVMPLNSAYDHALFWSYECQAEGDSVVRLDVLIDWGEPLAQRIVDGLLVAQRNPRPEQGIYNQSNAESTRVFGNPHGRPESATLDDAAGTAHLVYYVLINGIVDVSLLLTISDVGEQAAWNGFLALRDTEIVFDRSNRAWDEALLTARLWTPNTRLNQAVHAGKQAAMQSLVHLRTGFAPVDRLTTHVPVLVEAFDALDPATSRNLLAHLRRIAERSQGRLPVQLPLVAKAALVDPGPALVQTNHAYLSALYAHTLRHPEAALLEEHAAAIALCAEALVRARPIILQGGVAADLWRLGAGLRAAMSLATRNRDGVNAMRWESEACDAEKQAEAIGAARGEKPAQPNWQAAAGWSMPANAPWAFADPWAGISLAAQAIWQGCGVSFLNGQPVVRPTFPAEWSWWALLDLPIFHTAQVPAGRRLSLVWDGAQLHTTEPLRTALPVVIHESIRALHTDELDFDLTFEFVDTQAGERVRTRFRPEQWE